MMQCPVCGSDRKPEYAKCPTCGVEFAKWVGKVIDRLNKQTKSIINESKAKTMDENKLKPIDKTELKATDQAKPEPTGETKAKTAGKAEPGRYREVIKQG